MDESPQHADWRRWLEDHAPKFLLFARQQARYEADAQDLVQEAVVEACRRQNDGEPPPRRWSSRLSAAAPLTWREVRTGGRVASQRLLSPCPCPGSTRAWKIVSGTS
jgi:DNA-directed RNA polymerase specialized sigma24 family protein